MKKILLVILLIPGFILAQNKHDNAIVIAHLPFKAAISGCMDQGFSIATKDDSLQYFTTLPKADKHRNLIILHIRIKDSVTIITGDLNPNMTLNFGMVSSQTALYQIEFKGMAGSPLKQSWESMNDVARSFGLPVSYAKL